MNNAGARRALLSGLSIAASVLLFLASLTQDGFYIEGENPRAWAPCVGLLLVGWIGVIAGVPAWLANPALALSWLLMCFRETRPLAIYPAIAALGLSLSFLAHRRVLTSELPSYSAVTGYGLGYWLWIASAGAAVVGCLVAAAGATPKQADVLRSP